MFFARKSGEDRALTERGVSLYNGKKTKLIVRQKKRKWTIHSEESKDNKGGVIFIMWVIFIMYFYYLSFYLLLFIAFVICILYNVIFPLVFNSVFRSFSWGEGGRGGGSHQCYAYQPEF